MYSNKNILNIDLSTNTSATLSTDQNGIIKFGEEALVCQDQTNYGTTDDIAVYQSESCIKSSGLKLQTSGPLLLGFQAFGPDPSPISITAACTFLKIGDWVTITINRTIGPLNRITYFRTFFSFDGLYRPITRASTIFSAVKNGFDPYSYESDAAGLLVVTTDGFIEIHKEGYSDREWVTTDGQGGWDQLSITYYVGSV